MTEQNPQGTTPPVDPTPADPPAPKPETKAAAKSDARFAVYDTTYLKFTGGTHDTKAKATKAAKDADVDKYEIREV